MLDALSLCKENSPAQDPRSSKNATMACTCHTIPGKGYHRQHSVERTCQVGQKHADSSLGTHIDRFCCCCCCCRLQTRAARLPQRQKRTLRRQPIKCQRQSTMPPRQRNNRSTGSTRRTWQQLCPLLLCLWELDISHGSGTSRKRRTSKTAGQRRVPKLTSQISSPDMQGPAAVVG